jgi:hypothetical protein
MSVTERYVAPLFAYLSLNCLFCVLRPLLCFSPCKLLLSFSYLFYCLNLLLSILCVLWPVLLILMYIAILAFCVQCKDHCHWGTPTAVNKYLIVSYRIVLILSIRSTCVTYTDSHVENGLAHISHDLTNMNKWQVFVKCTSHGNAALCVRRNASQFWYSVPASHNNLFNFLAALLPKLAATLHCQTL